MVLVWLCACALVCVCVCVCARVCVRHAQLLEALFVGADIKALDVSTHLLVGSISTVVCRKTDVEIDRQMDRCAEIYR